MDELRGLLISSCIYIQLIWTRYIETIADSEHVIPYLDLPVQHISQSVFEDESSSRRKNRNRLQERKFAINGLVLRTTVMVGFPGESDDDFKRLCDFVQEYEFDWLGAFAFSPGRILRQLRWLSKYLMSKGSTSEKIQSIQHRITRRKRRHDWVEKKRYLFHHVVLPTCMLAAVI